MNFQSGIIAINLDRAMEPLCSQLSQIKLRINCTLTHIILFIIRIKVSDTHTVISKLNTHVCGILLQSAHA